MKKIRIRIILLAAAVLLLLGLPPVFGMLTESQVRRQADSLREEGRLLVTVEAFERGWFSSRALLEIEPSPTGDVARQALLGFAEPLRVIADFKHGPVSIQDGVFVGFSEMLVRPAPTAAGESSGASPLDFEFRAQSTFGGNLNFAAQVMPFEAAAEDLALNFSGGTVYGTLSGERTQAWLDADTLQYRRGPVTFSVVGMHASADNERVSRYVLPGVMTLQIDRMSMNFGAGQSSALFDLSNLAIESSTTLDEARENLSGTMQLDLERLRVGSETITAARIETAAERLDTAALEAYSEAAARAAESAPSAPTGPMLADEVEPAVLRLLAGGPAVAINTLRFDVNDEPFEASLQATVDPAAMPPSGAADIRDPALWMGVLDGSAEVTVAKPLAERVAVMIAKSQIGASVMEGESIPGQSIDALAEARAGLVIAVLSAQGFIEDTGSLYRTALRLEDGRLTINGQPLPFGLP